MKYLLILIALVIGAVAIIPDVKLAVVGHVIDAQSRFSDDQVIEGKTTKFGYFRTNDIGQDAFHNGSGMIRIKTVDGKRYVQLGSSFKSTPGPDYHVYVSTKTMVQGKNTFMNNDTSRAWTIT